MALTRVRGNPKKQKFIVYDLEWYPRTLEVRLVGVYDGERYRAYPSVAEFLEAELTPKNRDAWFYAHAGGLADAQFLLEEFIDRPQYQVKGFFSGSSAIIIPVQKGRHRWTFIDSYWLLREKLAAIAKWSGQEKGGSEYFCPNHPHCGHTEESGLKCIFYAPYPILKDYNELDCVILWNAINEFQKRIIDLGGELRMTQASCALNLFRRRFLTADIATHRALNQRAQLSYVASRVEVYEQYCEDAEMYDINSSFPYSMTKSVPGHYLGADEKLNESEETYLVNASVRIPEMYLPPLPFKHRNRVFFPVGEWKSWFTAPDIELLRSTGGVIDKVHEVLHFEPMHDLRDYVLTLYEMRRTTKDPFEKAMLKLLLNSLYGKFAESEEKLELLLNPETLECTHDVPCVDNACIEELFPGAYLRHNSVPRDHAHVIMSSHITSNSRSHLYHFLNQCNRLFYTDTDSLVTKQTFPNSDKLGDLKYEGHINKATFLAPKLYIRDGKVKAKGFSNMTEEKFLSLLNGERVDYLRMARIRENFRLGRTSPVEQVYKKKLQLKSQPKRHYFKDGTSRPWHLNELR